MIPLNGVKKSLELRDFLYACLTHILEECSLVSWIADVFEIAHEAREHLILINSLKEECIPLELHRIEV